MFGEMFYTTVHINGEYVGRFIGFGKEYDGEGRNYTIVLYVMDDGALKGQDYNNGISFPDLAKDKY